MDVPQPQRLTDEQRFHWLRLIRTGGIGPVTFRQLIRRFGSAKAALEALPGLAASSPGARAFQPVSEVAVEAELTAAAACGARFVALGEPEYPRFLAYTESAPPLLAVLGDTGTLAAPPLAVVGSRNASANGMRFARDVAAALGADGFSVSSGLARGIDRAAHLGALETGGTIAVLAGGLDRPYPPQNLDVLERIAVAKGSCAISVMPFGHEPQARDFPRRNAIIAGLSLAVVVVEAAERSGSLITATMATELGRIVFATPGHPVDPRSHGTNSLIREGAELVRSADDILEVVRPLRGAPPPRPVIPASGSGGPEPRGPLAAARRAEDTPPAPSAASTTNGIAPGLAFPVRPAVSGAPVDIVLALLGPAPTRIDDLVRDSGLAAAAVHAALLDLELDGRIERGSGGVVSLLI
jgi:DNA processing protein